MERPVHLIGIGGYGMSALAHVLLDRGIPVTGSDAVDQSSIARLRERGARIMIGHDPACVVGASLCVYSTAIAHDHVELQAARAHAIPVLHRAELLAQWLNDGYGIAVSGAHGKTTTTAMIACALEEAGCEPTYVVGAELMQDGRPSKAGAGTWVVAEADESDRSFLLYRPQIAVVTNVEPDHLEHYDGDFAQLVAAYVTYVSYARSYCVVCLDDPHVAQWVAHDPRTTTTASAVPWVTYGMHAQAQYRATDVVVRDRGASFVLWINDRSIGPVQLAVPGVHNVSNALAAIAVCHVLDVPLSPVIAALATFRGTKRRFHVHYDRHDRLVVDDYAHHPTEVRATIAAAKATGKRVIAVFQPQRYSRTAQLFEEFAQAFGEADVAVISDIYAPVGETPIAGISAERLVERIRFFGHEHIVYGGTEAHTTQWLKTHVRGGDVIVTMGAGTIWRVAQEMARWLEQQEPFFVV